MAILSPAAHEQVETAHANVFVGRKIQGTSIGMQEWRHFSAFGVDRRAKVLRLAPTAIAIAAAAIDVGIAIAPRYKKQLAAIAAHARLRFPAARIDIALYLSWSGPYTTLKFRNIEVTAAIASPATARQVKFAAISGNKSRPWVEVLWEIGKNKLLRL